MILISIIFNITICSVNITSDSVLYFYAVFLGNHLKPKRKLWHWINRLQRIVSRISDLLLSVVSSHSIILAFWILSPGYSMYSIHWVFIILFAVHIFCCPQVWDEMPCHGYKNYSVYRILFEYMGANYTHCTTVDSVSMKAWCSLTLEWKGRWKYCYECCVHGVCFCDGERLKDAIH